MWFIVAIGSFLSGIIGSMGFGSGTVLIILLSVFLSFEQTKAQGINLLFFIPCAIYSIYYYSKKKLIKKEYILPLVIPGLIGAGLGYRLLTLFSPNLLAKLFGGLLIVIAIRQFIGLFKKH